LIFGLEERVNNSLFHLNFFKESIKNDLTKVLEEIKENPKGGIDLENNLYKIRLANSPKLFPHSF